MGEGKVTGNDSSELPPTLACVSLNHLVYIMLLIALPSQEEREWRKKWLKDQELSHREPRFVPEYYKATMNPIRRFYRLPLDFVFKKLEPTLVRLKQEGYIFHSVAL